MKIARAMICVLALCLCASHASADVAVVKGSGKRIELKQHKGTSLLHIKQAADAWNWTIKFIGEGDAQLIAVCRDTICIPLSLKDTVHLETKGGLFIDAAKLGRVMGFKVTSDDDRITLEPTGKAEDSDTSDVPTYHDAWGKDRGFRKGQTLPDIPLVDMQGHEVRFGNFLGKQYIIYGWASW